ncbi:MAG TPA: ATP-binding protein, partial [Planctomycetota bacterium]|nr:ATP-binding protein [Planctomycetota bacterium]
PIDLAATARKVVAEALATAGSLGGSLTVDPSLGQAWGHPGSLQQALENLIANALKFVPFGVKPEIRIWSREQGDRIRLVVEDNGIGIRPQDHAKIFLPFERLHTQAEYPGTGLGLAIVKRAMERMGGQAGVESVLGQGSRFWVELPRRGIAPNP